MFLHERTAGFDRAIWAAKRRLRRRSPSPIRFAADPVSVTVQTPRKAALVPVEGSHTRGANLITIRKYIARRQCIEDGLPLLCTVPSIGAEGEAETGSHRDKAITLSRLKRALGPRRTPPSVGFVEVPTKIVPRHPACLSRNPQRLVKPDKRTTSAILHRRSVRPLEGRSTVRSRRQSSADERPVAFKRRKMLRERPECRRLLPAHRFGRGSAF